MGQIKEVGNVWFKNTNLDKYIEKRYRQFMSTRSSSETGTSVEFNILPASLGETSIDEEKGELS